MPSLLGDRVSHSPYVTPDPARALRPSWGQYHIKGWRWGDYHNHNTDLGHQGRNMGGGVNITRIPPLTLTPNFPTHISYQGPLSSLGR